MNDDLNGWLKLGAALVLGMVIGGYAGVLGSNREDVLLAQTRDASEAVAKLQADVAALSASTAAAAAAGAEKTSADMAALAARLDGTDAKLGTVAADVLARLDGMEAKVAGAIAETGAAHSTALNGAFERVAASLSGLAATTAPAPDAAAVSPAAPAPEATTTAPADLPGAIGPGQTVTLADGALRVFMSVVTDDEFRSSAVVAVNGLSTVTLPIGRPVEVLVEERPCTLTLDAVAGRRAIISGSCS